MYTINKNCLVPKWYTIDEELPIPTGTCWKLNSASTTIKINVQEFDEGKETTTTISHTTGFSSNADTESTSGSDATVKTSYGTNVSNSTTYTTTVKSTDKTDDLGDIVIDYIDTIIRSHNADGTYTMRVYTTGTVYMMIFPRKL